MLPAGTGWVDGGPTMPDDARMTVREVLQAAMDEKGWTQDELGEHITREDTGAHAQQGRISDWMRGTALPSRVWHKSIARLAKMSTRDFAALVSRERQRSKGFDEARMARMESDVADLKRTLRTILDRLPGD